MDIMNPTVGLVNIGTEETKGTTIIKAAYELLSKSSMRFVGNIEARDIPKASVTSLYVMALLEILY